MISHQGGLSGWSVIRVVSSEWSHQSGLSSGCTVIRMCCHKGGLSEWSLIRVVSHQGGLPSGWSVIKVVSSEWSLVRDCNILCPGSIFGMDEFRVTCRPVDKAVFDRFKRAVSGCPETESGRCCAGCRQR